LVLRAPSGPALDRTRQSALRTGELVALAGIVVIGMWLRMAGLTSHGLWRDDAWVALSGRVSIATALRMGATAPGFTLIERAWILFDPASSRWAQLLPLVLGGVGIVAMFCLARYLRLSVWLSLGTAALIALSPVAIAYSTHVKQYSADLVLACALMGLGEAARRRTERRPLGALVAVSCVGFVITASVVAVIVGVWAMLLVVSLADRRARRRVIWGGAVTALGCGVASLLWYSHLSHALPLFWSQQHRFLEITPLHKVVPQLTSMVSDAVLKAHSGAVVTASVGIALTVVALVGLGAGPRIWSSGLVIAAALFAAALGLIPWGTGRTDEVLYPALALLLAFGVERLARGAAARAPGVAMESIVAGLIGVALVAGMVRADVEHPAVYPAVDARLLMREVAAHERPGDLVYVSSASRYPWVLQSPDRPRLVMGTGWGAGYTVTSTRSDEFIAPSYSWEVAFHPGRWARRTTSARRLWFIGGGFPPNRTDYEYQAIRRAGWRPVKVLHATGSVAVLMTRS
jgi:hypothetical protein